MNRWIAIPVIIVLVVAVAAIGYFAVQQTNRLTEAESEIVALEDNVSTLEANISVLEAKVTDLEAALDKANDDVKLQQKLVGCGACAEWTYPSETDVNHLNTGFFLTNPDCVSEMTIDRISVFSYDGTVVYEGPLRVKVDDEWEVYTGPLKPHETLQTGLAYYDLPEITHEVEMWYTVEVFWTWTDKEGLPLTGWASSIVVVRDAVTGEAIDIMMWGTTQMINMEQELESKDKD